MLDLDSNADAFGVLPDGRAFGPARELIAVTILNEIKFNWDMVECVGWRRHPTHRIFDLPLYAFKRPVDTQ